MKDFEVNEGLTDEFNPEMLRPEKVVELLKARGIYVSPEQAVQIVELLDRFSTMIVTQHLRQCK
jgi:hypothetical protein